MDRVTLQKKISAIFDRYKYVLVVVGIGLVLMIWPAKDAETSAPKTQTQIQQAQQQSFTDELCAILGQIRGVGRVKVMITEQQGAATHYQTDESGTTESDRSSLDSKTVLVSSGGVQTALITSVSPPVYLGAIIVCQGGDDPAVRLAVSKAVSTVTGIRTDRISVLKMK